jgi:activator of 2-hydroxyglutaryl-CoA dehydratase
MSASRWLLGVDLGSTALKVVLADAQGTSIAWRRYERHESLVAEKLLGWLRTLEREVGISPANCRAFATGVSSRRSMPPRSSSSGRIPARTR